jgi:hypothetical protein
LGRGFDPHQPYPPSLPRAHVPGRVRTPKASCTHLDLRTWSDPGSANTLTLDGSLPSGRNATTPWTIDVGASSFCAGPSALFIAGQVIARERKSRIIVQTFVSQTPSKSAIFRAKVPGSPLFIEATAGGAGHCDSFSTRLYDRTERGSQDDAIWWNQGFGGDWFRRGDRRCAVRGRARGDG